MSNNSKNRPTLEDYKNCLTDINHFVEHSVIHDFEIPDSLPYFKAMENMRLVCMRFFKEYGIHWKDIEEVDRDEQEEFEKRAEEAKKINIHNTKH